MADVSFTAASFKETTSTITIHGYAGEAVTRGLAVYFDSTTGEYFKADCTNSAKDAVVGLVLNDAGDGQPIKIAIAGSVACDGLTLVATTGCVYVLSTAGAICPHSDLAASDYVTIIGAATATTALKLSINVTSVQGTA